MDAEMNRELGRRKAPPRTHTLTRIHTHTHAVFTFN